MPYSTKRLLMVFTLAIALLGIVMFGLHMLRMCCEPPIPLAPIPAVSAAVNGMSPDGASSEQEPSRQQIDFKLISRVGELHPIAAAGGRLYAAGASAITVFDIAKDPDAPLPVGRTEPNFEGVNHAVVRDGLLYATSSDGRLWIFDVTDPTNPHKIGIFGEGNQQWRQGEIILEGDYAFIGWDQDGVQVIDVSKPEHPKEVAVYPIPGYGLSSDGRYLYVISDEEENGTRRGLLRVLDSTDPSHFQPVGAVVLPRDPGNDLTYYKQFNVSKGRGFLLTGGGLYTYDLSHPETPQQVAFLAVSDSNANFQVRDDLLFLAAGGVIVVDVSDVTQPRRIGRFDGQARGYGSGVLVDDRVYQYSDPPSITVVDVSNPTVPKQSGFLVFPAEVTRLERRGSYLFAIEGSQSTNRFYSLHIIDIKDPRIPHEVGTFYLAVDSPHDRLKSFVLYNKYALVAATQNFYVVDISSPAFPREVFRLPVSIGIGGVTTFGIYAYLHTEQDLRVYDLTDPAAPTLVGAVDAPVSVWKTVDLQVIGGHLYLFSHDGVHVYDISMPQKPVLTAIETKNWWIHGVKLLEEAGYLYVLATEATSGVTNLHVYDVGEPAHPKEVMRIPGFGSPSNIYVRGDTAMIGESTGNVNFLSVYDITQPLSPTLALTRTLAPGRPITPLGGAGSLLFLGSDFSLWELRAQASTVFSSTGSELRSLIDRTHYSFPPNSFSSQTPVIVTHTSLFTQPQEIGPLQDIGHAFQVIGKDQITGSEVRLITPYTLTVRYSDRERGPVTEESLALYHWDGAAWMRAPSSKLDPDTNTIMAMPRELGLWAVLGHSYYVYLPVVSFTGSVE